MGETRIDLSEFQGIYSLSETEAVIEKIKDKIKQAKIEMEKEEFIKATNILHKYYPHKLPLDNDLKAMQEYAEWYHNQRKQQPKEDIIGTISLAKIDILVKALEDIENWDDDLEDEWEDQGYRAKEALRKFKEQNK